MELIQHDFSIGEYNEKPLVICPIGDLQYDGVGTMAEKRLKDHIQKALDLDARFIGMGDYIDFMSPSNRHSYAGAKIYDTGRRIIAKAAERLVDELYDGWLAPTKGKWLGVLEGHHYSDLLDGRTSDQYLCEKLDAPFLGTSALISLRFVRGGGTKHKRDFFKGRTLIYAHHGTGSGMTPAAPVNKMAAFAGSLEADVYLIAHYSRLCKAHVNRMYSIWSEKKAKLLHKDKLIVGTGAFARSYVEGNKHGQVPRGSYPEQGMLPPATLGAPIIRVTPKLRDRVIDGERFIWFEAEITEES